MRRNVRLCFLKQTIIRLYVSCSWETWIRLSKSLTVTSAIAARRTRRTSGLILLLFWGANSLKEKKVFFGVVVSSTVVGAEMK